MDVVVAAFDVDGTLTVRDCVVPFMGRVAGRRALVWHGLSALWTIPGGVARRDRDALKEHFTRNTFRGRNVEDVSVIGEDFADFVLGHWMRSDVLRRMRWHQESGHEVVLVSASLAPYLRPLGSRLGVGGVLCTELEQEAGVYTGALSGRNCRGQEKVDRLTAWLASRNIESSAIEWAYGDSSGDRELLSVARRPNRVHKTDVQAVPG